MARYSRKGKRLRKTYKKTARTRRFKQRKGYSSVARARGGAVTGEMKYFDSEVNSSAVVGAATWGASVIDPTVTPVANMNCLFAPVVGAGINQRIGKAAWVHSIKIWGDVLAPAVATVTALANPSDVRILLVKDCQTNSAQAAGSAVMQTPVSNNNIVAINAPLNIDNFGRFKILKEKRIQLSEICTGNVSATNFAIAGVQRKFKLKHIFAKPVLVRFNNTNGGTVADIVDNSFHIYALTTSTGMVPAMSYYCRVGFKEEG